MKNNNIIKKILFILGLVMLPSLCALATVTASGGSAIDNPLGNTNSITALVVKLVTLAAQLGGVVCVFFIIYSGFLFVKAQGKPEEIETAKRTLLWSLVGAAVLLGASVIANVIKSTVESVTGSSLPK